MIALDPFFQMVNDRGKTFLASFMVKFFRACIFDARQIACSLNHGHLHAQANAQIGDFFFTRILGCANFTLGTAFPKTTRD